MSVAPCADSHAARTFLDILAHGRQPYRILTLMNESGVLGRFLPEFGRVVAQTQFNMYHSYTVDEHTLRAIGIINDVENGRLKADHPLATSIFPLIADREALYLAMLLHDTGKGLPEGQEVGGAIAARSACERLGLSPERVSTVAWLVEHHLMMSDFAQKRDVADPRTVAAFAEIVQNPERLRKLLTLLDTEQEVQAVQAKIRAQVKEEIDKNQREYYLREQMKAIGKELGGGEDGPAEVEALMFRHPAIQEACIIATKDAYRGESVKAVVVLRPSHQGQVSEQDIIDWCRDNMAVYKVPRVVQFADALPKSGSGKVMWRALQEAESVG